MTIEQQQQRLRRLVESHGIRDRRVLDVLGRTRRDLFVPPDIRHRAYDDTALPIGDGQTISQPYMVALMTQELSLTGVESVLEIGTGSGYQTAILSQLAREVVTIERIADLSQAAEAILTELDYTNIEFHVGDGTLGCPQRAPFDGIIVTAAAPDIPIPLYDQLKPADKMVVPVGDEAVQTLVVAEKRETKPKGRKVCGCRFVKLIGEAGWPTVD